jgi:hypothetical protein
MYKCTIYTLCTGTTVHVIATKLHSQIITINTSILQLGTTVLKLLPKTKKLFQSNSKSKSLYKTSSNTDLWGLTEVTAHFTHAPAETTNPNKGTACLIIIS